ncbi:hypothetical protein Ct61P_05653 [Colletotrichum tofieldiae]|nr:hypothetical protein Ct61P_05653 [Colletotrichum tofieldiae]
MPVINGSSAGSTDSSLYAQPKFNVFDGTAAASWIEDNEAIGLFSACTLSMGLAVCYLEAKHRLRGIGNPPGSGTLVALSTWRLSFDSSIFPKAEPLPGRAEWRFNVRGRAGC